MKNSEKQEIWDNGTTLLDYPIDVNMKGEQESNGSVEHLVAYNVTQVWLVAC